MKVVGPDKTYIDYFQGAWSSQEWGSNRFGIRVRERLHLVVLKVVDGRANVCSEEFRIPVHIETLPVYIRMIVYNHLLNYPASDLIDVVSGIISFQQAIDYPQKIEPHRATAIGPEELRDNA